MDFNGNKIISHLKVWTIKRPCFSSRRAATVPRRWLASEKRVGCVVQWHLLVSWVTTWQLQESKSGGGSFSTRADPTVRVAGGRSLARLSQDTWTGRQSVTAPTQRDDHPLTDSSPRFTPDDRTHTLTGSSLDWTRTQNLLAVTPPFSFQINLRNLFLFSLVYHFLKKLLSQWVKHKKSSWSPKSSSRTKNMKARLW